MHAIWIIFLLAIGASIGSFLNVVIYRLPRKESLVFPGSHCPACGRGIHWYDNIPIVSWLVLRGRCRACGVRISPRYLVIELITAVLVAGLYVMYYVVEVRQGAGSFEESWPMFLAHATLLCALLACSAVDIEQWIILRPVCVFAALVGMVVATAAPHPWLPSVGPVAGAVAVGATVGLLVSLWLQRKGILLPSFLDAVEPAVPAPPARPASRAAKPAKGSRKGRKGKKKGRSGPAVKAARPAPAAGYAYSREHGVNPRVEILRELLFLAPAVVLAVVAWVLVGQVGAIGSAWARVADPEVGGRLALHVGGFLASLFGLLIGGLWIWGVRILGTLGFGKEAMGLGDADLMGTVGAVTGWVVPSIAFFLAPFFGLGWALVLWLGRGQRELPYGPWLALATLVVMVLHDPLVELFRPYAEAFAALAR